MAEQPLTDDELDAVEREHVPGDTSRRGNAGRMVQEVRRLRAILPAFAALVERVDQDGLHCLLDQTYKDDRYPPAAEYPCESYCEWQALLAAVGRG